MEKHFFLLSINSFFNPIGLLLEGKQGSHIPSECLFFISCSQKIITTTLHGNVVNMDERNKKGIHNTAKISVVGPVMCNWD